FICLSCSFLLVALLLPRSTLFPYTTLFRSQKSIFEFELTEAQYINLMKRLKEKGFLKRDPNYPDDSINIYYFDKNTETKTQRFGKKEPIIDRKLLSYI